METVDYSIGDKTTDSSHMSKQNLSYKDIPQGYPTWGGGEIPMKPCSELEILEQLPNSEIHYTPLTRHIPI